MPLLEENALVSQERRGKMFVQMGLFNNFLIILRRLSLFSAERQMIMKFRSYACARESWDPKINGGALKERIRSFVKTVLQVSKRDRAYKILLGEK